jgi:hypothetical protein
VFLEMRIKHNPFSNEFFTFLKTGIGQYCTVWTSTSTVISQSLFWSLLRDVASACRQGGKLRANKAGLAGGYLRPVSRAHTVQSLVPEIMVMTLSSVRGLKRCNHVLLISLPNLWAIFYITTAINNLYKIFNSIQLYSPFLFKLLTKDM